jgi:hypothetical protein
MTKRTRYFMFGSVTVLLVGLCTGLVAYYTGMPMGAFGQVEGPSELQYVPADAVLVAYADVQQVMKSDLRKKLHSTMVRKHDDKGQEEFQSATGIDIEHDIDHVVAFLEPNPTEKYSGMVLATGRFDAARLETLARQHGGQVEDYKGKRLITKSGNEFEGRTHHSFTVAFINPGLVGVGETGVIKHALDRQGGQSVLANREMMNLVNDMDDSNTWAVGRFDALISQAKLPEGVVSKIPAVRWFSANGHINGGLRGNIRAEARDEQAGQNLRDVVQGFLALAKLQAGQKPELQGLLDSLQLAGTGKTVSLSFEVPPQIFDLIGDGADHQADED